MRDNFSKITIDLLKKQTAYLCSNPECVKPTVGPSADGKKSINIGVAAHICAASIGGPRYDKEMTSEQRKNVENGI